MKFPDGIADSVARGWRAIYGTGDSQLVPQGRLSGPMPWVIAIMVALTLIAAAGGLALRNTAATAASQLSGGVTVQIIEARPEERARQAAAALSRLRETPGVISRVLSRPKSSMRWSSHGWARSPATAMPYRCRH